MVVNEIFPPTNCDDSSGYDENSGESNQSDAVRVHEGATCGDKNGNRIDGIDLNP